MRRLIVTLTVLMLVLRPAPSSCADQAQPGGKKLEIVVTGKVFASVTQQINMPFRGTIVQVRATTGTQMKKGDILATYQLEPDTIMHFKQRLSRVPVELMKLELDAYRTDLAELNKQLQDAKRLVKHDLASKESVKLIEPRIRLVNKRISFKSRQLKRDLAHIIEDEDFLKGLLGVPVSTDRIPEQAHITAPMDGILLTINPALREGARIGPMDVGVIGDLDPMRVLADIHEIEVVHVEVGDEAEFTLESLPGRKYKAVVTRIAWTPTTGALDQPSYYRVEFSLSNPDLVLKDGQRGKIQMIKIIPQ